MRKIKEGVREIILKSPIWSLYIRRDLRLPCDCYSSPYNAPSHFCTKCLGTGHVIRVEKVPLRFSMNTRELKGENDVTLLGRIDQATLRAYSTDKVHPKDNDLIVHTLWNKPGEERDALPTSVLRVYSVQIAFPMMQDEISFYELGLNPYHAYLPELINGLREHPLNIGVY